MESLSAAAEAVDSTSTKPEEVAAYQSSDAKQARLQSMLSALLDDPILADVANVAVLNTAAVKDLKLAIRKKINEIEQEQMGHRHISWKHIWDNYCLTHHSEKLLDDNSALSSHGIRNNSKPVPNKALVVEQWPAAIQTIEHHLLSCQVLKNLDLSSELFGGKEDT